MIIIVLRVRFVHFAGIIYCISLPAHSVAAIVCFYRFVEAGVRSFSRADFAAAFASIVRISPPCSFSFTLTWHIFCCSRVRRRSRAFDFHTFRFSSAHRSFHIANDLHHNRADVRAFHLSTKSLSTRAEAIIAHRETSGASHYRLL